MRTALELAMELATRDGFDSLHDPDPSTELIEAYHDPVGFPTQGYGRLLSRQRWADLGQYEGVTEPQARQWLRSDMQRAARQTHALVPNAVLNEGQWAALYDFTFNVGSGNLEVSTLRSQLNRSEYDDIPYQLSRWVYAGSIKLNGLIRRRQAEITMWEHEA